MNFTCKGSSVDKALICIMGGTASGKDTLVRTMLEKYPTIFDPLVYCTTRPMREGEISGETYHFLSKNRLEMDREVNDVLEEREYHVVGGDIWYYWTTFSSVKPDHIYLTQASVDQVNQYIDKLDQNTLLIQIFLDVPERVRMNRLIKRDGGVLSDESRRRLKEENLEIQNFRFNPNSMRSPNTITKNITSYIIPSIYTLTHNPDEIAEYIMGLFGIIMSKVEIVMYDDGHLMSLNNHLFAGSGDILSNILNKKMYVDLESL